MCYHKYLILLFYFFTNSAQPEKLHPHASVTKPVYVIPRKDVILHNAVFPIRIIVDLPNYTFPKDTRPCKAHVLLCVALNHTAKVQNYLTDEIFNSNPYVTGEMVENPKKHRVIRGLFNVAGYIQKFLWGTATSDDVDQLHVDIGNMGIEINKAFTKSQQYMFEVSHNVSAYSRNLSSAVEKGFDELDQKIKDLKQEKSYTEIIVADIVNILIVSLHLQSVSQLMTSVASDCRNSLIPRAVITDVIMQKRMTEIQQHLEKHHYELAANLNQLLKLKIGHCYFSKDKLTVTINLPIRTQNSGLKLYKIMHIPYIFEEQECFLNTDIGYIVQSKSRMVAVTKDMMAFCNPDSDKLCLVSENNYTPSPFSKCAEALIGSRSDAIIEDCVMTCRKSLGLSITQVSSTNYVVVNARNIKISCLSNDDKDYYLHPIGAAEVIIGCYCKVIVRDETKDKDIVIRPSFPCISSLDDDEHSVTHIIPPQFSTLENSIFDESSVTYANISKIINPDWKLEIPTLSLEPPTPVQLSTKFIAEELQYNVSQSTTIIYIWLVLITAALIALGFFLVMNSGVPSKPGFNMVPFLMLGMPGFGFCLDPKSSQNISFTETMWALLQAIEIMNVVCGTIVMIFVISMLLYLYKALKNIRMCSRMLRMYDESDEFLMRRHL